jgi:hypothetical protein
MFRRSSLPGPRSTAAAALPVAGARPGRSGRTSPGPLPHELAMAWGRRPPQCQGQPRPPAPSDGVATVEEGVGDRRERSRDHDVEVSRMPMTWAYHRGEESRRRPGRDDQDGDRHEQQRRRPNHWARRRRPLKSCPGPARRRGERHHGPADVIRREEGVWRVAPARSAWRGADRACGATGRMGLRTRRPHPTCVHVRSSSPSRFVRTAGRALPSGRQSPSVAAAFVQCGVVRCGPGHVAHGPTGPETDVETPDGPLCLPVRPASFP